MTDAVESTDAMIHLFRIPVLTRRRIWIAFAIAIAADGIQMLLGPMGWIVFDQVIDILAMILTSLLIGFHPLFLPTFALEFIPVVDMVPTWTGCVAVVVALKRKQQRPSSAPPRRTTPPDVIDV